MVNGADDVFVERKGRLERVEGLVFEGEGQVFHLIERIVAPLGLRVDESMPYVDARLSDGSRVNVIISPLSLCGPVITIRKFTLRPFMPEDLVRLGTLTAPMMEFLGACVRALEARPANVEGAGEVTVRALVRNALRMRPDRIIVGEVRGGEALDMLQAMNTGHEGSLSTAHANSPRDLLSRLETMALMSDVELPVSHVREQIAGALDLIVHTGRTSEGGRVVSRISAVEGLRAGSVVLEDIFAWRRGPGPAFEATGRMPSVMKLLEDRDERVDPRVFTARPRAAEEASPRRSRPQRGMPARGSGRTPSSTADPAHPVVGGWPGSIRQLGTLVE